MTDARGRRRQLRTHARLAFLLAATSLLASIGIFGGCSSDADAPEDAGTDARRVPRPIDGGSGTAEDEELPCVSLQPDAEPAVVPASYRDRQNPFDASAVAAGQAVYVTACKRCHGPEGRGGGDLIPPAADLTAHAHADDYLFWRIARGGDGDPLCSRMPAFEPLLSEEERWQVVTFVRSIEPDAGTLDGAAQ